MTVYVDDMFMSAQVGRINAKWCHLFSDKVDTTELHEFAQSIGLARQWFQRGKQKFGEGKPLPWKDHYDVTESKRAAALARGAVPVTMKDAVEIWQRKREECQGKLDA